MTNKYFIVNTIYNKCVLSVSYILVKWNPAVTYIHYISRSLDIVSSMATRGVFFQGLCVSSLLLVVWSLYE